MIGAVLVAGLLAMQDREQDLRRGLAEEARSAAQTLKKTQAWDEVLFLGGFVGADEALALAESSKAPRVTNEAVARTLGRRFGGRFQELARRSPAAQAARLTAMAEVLNDLPDHLAAFRKINAMRRACGLPVVAYDFELAVGCQLHCRYLGAHPDDGHEEKDTQPEYTEAGAAAGRRSALASGSTIVEAVDAWMGTFYHRIAFLDPALRRVGTGQLKRAGQSACDVLSARANADARCVAWPPANAAAVPTGFAGNETPNPIAGDKDGRAGFPVTLTWFGGGVPAVKRAVLRDEAGREVECWVSTPDRPARDDQFQDNMATVCLIAKSPLRSGRKYRVFIESEKGRHEWSFATR